MRINNNLMAMNTHRQLGTANAGSAKSIEKLSSGYRINRAGDDAAGLAISEKMRSQVRGLNQASRNSQDGISMIQTAEGALNESQAILQRMRELAVQSANDTNVNDDRTAIQNEIDQLTEEIDRIANNTEFNTRTLLDGSLSKVESGTSITKTIAKSGDSIPSFAVGTEWTGLAGKAPKITNGTDDNQIKFEVAQTDADNEFSWNINSTEDNELSIERSGDKLLVSIKATDTDGDALEVKNIEMAYDATNAKFVYEANGVTFDISKAEFDKNFTTGAKLTIDLNEYAFGGTDADLTGATVGTVSDFKQTLAASGTTVGEFSASGITVDNTDANFIDSVVGIKITGTNLDGAAGYTVDLLDEDGNSVVSESFTGIAASTALNYEAHGIKFDFTVNDAVSMELEMDFATASSTTTTTEETDNSVQFQIGSNQGQTMSVSVNDMRAAALGVKGVDITTSGTASDAITTIDKAITKVSDERAKLGAVQNRLEHTIKNLDTSAENLQASESRIRDVDMAQEMMEQTRQNILAQASTAMLAQANQAPQAVLQLLR